MAQCMVWPVIGANFVQLLLTTKQEKLRISAILSNSRETLATDRDAKIYSGDTFPVEVVGFV